MASYDEPRVYNASAGRTSVSVGGGESLSGPTSNIELRSNVGGRALLHLAVLAGPIYEQSSVGDGRPGKISVRSSSAVPLIDPRRG